MPGGSHPAAAPGFPCLRVCELAVWPGAFFTGRGTLRVISESCVNSAVVVSDRAGGWAGGCGSASGMHVDLHPHSSPLLHTQHSILVPTNILILTYCDTYQHTDTYQATCQATDTVMPTTLLGY